MVVLDGKHWKILMRSGDRVFKKKLSFVVTIWRWTASSFYETNQKAQNFQAMIKNLTESDFYKFSRPAMLIFFTDAEPK